MESKPSRAIGSGAAGLRSHAPQVSISMGHSFQHMVGLGRVLTGIAIEPFSLLVSISYSF